MRRIPSSIQNQTSSTYTFNPAGNDIYFTESVAVFLPLRSPLTALCGIVFVSGELEDKDQDSFVQENRGDEGRRDREGANDRPVSAYNLICANEEAGGSGC